MTHLSITRRSPGTSGGSRLGGHVTDDEYNNR
jgi:hypothetical protein